MQQFLVLFREPDGRKDQHTPEAITHHRENWRIWMDTMNKEKRLAGGMPLTLTGRIIKDGVITEGPHTVGEEIIGGCLLINAAGLDEATSLIQSCPIFEFDGYAEIRESMTPALPSAQAPDTSSSAKIPTSPEAINKAIVRRFNTAFIQQGDIAVFHEIIDPAVINHTAPPGVSNGADGMLAVIELFRNALTGLEVKIHRQVAEDDIVVTHKSFHATHTGELLGNPPSGKPIVINIIDIVRLRDGKYVEHWGIRDLKIYF